MDLFKLLKEAIENPQPTQGQMSPESFVQGFHGIIKAFMASVLKQPETVKRILSAKSRGLEMAFWDAVNKTYPGLWNKLGRNNQLQLEMSVRDHYAPQFLRRAQEMLQLQKPKIADVVGQKPQQPQQKTELRSVQKMRQQQAPAPQPQA